MSLKERIREAEIKLDELKSTRTEKTREFRKEIGYELHKHIWETYEINAELDERVKNAFNLFISVLAYKLVDME